MHISSKKPNKTKMCHIYPRSQTRFFYTASSRAPGLFQNDYVMNRDLGPFFCWSQASQPNQRFQLLHPGRHHPQNPPRDRRETIPVKNGLNQNIKRPALRLFGPNKSLPLHLQHSQSPRLGHLCGLHGLPPPSPCLDQNSAECLRPDLLPATTSHAIPRPVGSRAQCSRPRACAVHDDCHAGF